MLCRYRQGFRNDGIQKQKLRDTARRSAPGPKVSGCTPINKLHRKDSGVGTHDRIGLES